MRSVGYIDLDLCMISNIFIFLNLIIILGAFFQNYEEKLISLVSFAVDLEREFLSRSDVMKIVDNIHII
jgi:hypothetical protein